MNKNKEYYKNTIILFLGKFSTQFVSFLLLPIFTRYLITSDYGYVDLLQTYISLLMPIIILRTDSSVFRFLVDERKNDEEKQSTIINSIIIATCGIILIILFYLICSIFCKIKYLNYILLNTIILIFSNIFLQISRGIGKNTEYSITSTIIGISNLLVNIILIIILNHNASSILIASIISNALGTIYLILKLKLYKYINIKKINLIKLKKMLKYSIPMIPNALSWWIVNVSDRSIISLVLGVTANGIYTISCKFSNILNSIFNVFNMSWTEMVALHINDDDNKDFFEKMINKLLFLFSGIGILIIGLLPLIYDKVIGNNYISSYNYIPILIIAGSGDVLAWLCGGIYIAKKQTKQVAKTTIISAAINFVVNISLIKRIGLYAACISTLIAYFFLAIYRYYDCQKIIKFKIEEKKLLTTIISFTTCTTLYYLNITELNIINGIVSIFLFIIINKHFIKEIIEIVKLKLGGIQYEKNNKTTNKKSY